MALRSKLRPVSPGAVCRLAPAAPARAVDPDASFSVSKRDLIGKYTRFVMRRYKRPMLIERCLLPRRSQGSRCPED